ARDSPRAASEPRDAAEHPTEPGARLHLQHARRPDRRRPAVSVRRPPHQPDLGERRDDPAFPVSDCQCVAPAPCATVGPAQAGRHTRPPCFCGVRLQADLSNSFRDRTPHEATLLLWGPPLGGPQRTRSETIAYIDPLPRPAVVYSGVRGSSLT